MASQGSDRIKAIWSGMSDAVKVAIILGFSLAVTSILIGGIYSIVPLPPHEAYRYNRFTGSAEVLFGKKAMPVVPESEPTTAEPKNPN
jgi:hypothetical protein